MNKITLAKDVWGHLGQKFESLDDNTVESRLFIDSLVSSTKALIYKVAPNSFIYPFQPTLIKRADAADNAFQANQYLYPPQLIQLLKRADVPALAGFFPFATASGVSSYEAATDRKIIVVRGSDNPILLGLFSVTNFAYWNPQLFETLGLYMAWKMSNLVGEQGSERGRLYREYKESAQEAKILDTNESFGNRQRQSGSWTDVIDFSQTPYYGLGNNIFPYFPVS